ncbi:MAG: hypothetical protein ACREIG_02585 [Nitrospiraceae bacterium]
MIDGCEGAVAIETPRIVKRWAETLPSDLALTFHGGTYGGGFEVHLTESERPVSFLEPAFVRANSIRDGLGWQLLNALDTMAWSHGLVMTPSSLFDMTSSHRWYGETSDKAFREQYVENNLDGEQPPDSEELASLDGPDSFFEQFPGMPHQVVRPDRQRCRVRKAHQLQDASTYFRLAGRAQSDWECKLLLALSAVSDFKQAKFPTIWDLMGTNGYEFESGSVSYYIRWSHLDDMGYWVDEVMNEIWNNGLAFESVLAFSFGDVQPKEVDALVETIEACRDYRLVMDQVLEVLLQAEKNDGSAIQ